MTTNQPRRRRLNVKLYEGGGVTSRFVEAEINDNGDLVISGQDVGKAPLEFWGDSDYEYWLKVISENKDKLLKALIEYCEKHSMPIPAKSRNKDRDLLAIIKLIFGGRSTAFEKFQRFLKRQDIPAEFASYV